MRDPDPRDEIFAAAEALRGLCIIANEAAPHSESACLFAPILSVINDRLGPAADRIIHFRPPE